MRAACGWRLPQWGYLFLPALLTPEQVPTGSSGEKQDGYQQTFNVSHVQVNLNPSLEFKRSSSLLNCFKKKNCTIYSTNLWAIQEANRVARQQRGLYPSQIVLRVSLGVRAELRLDRLQEGQGEQGRGRPVWSALQLALVHQGVTERHDLTGNTEQTPCISKEKKRLMVLERSFKGWADGSYLFIRYCTLSWTTASRWSSNRLNRLSSIPSDLEEIHMKIWSLH